MKDIRLAAESMPGYPPLLFFYQGSVEDGADFFKRFWPEARAVSDLPNAFYHAFGLAKAKLNQVFNADVLVCSIRAAAKGNFLGAVTGDPLMMPGIFLVQGDAILWQHYYKHLGDHPDFAKIPQITAECRLRITTSP